MKREKLHKVAVIEFCSIAQIKKLLKSMYETIETYIMFRKRWKGKVAQSGGSRASWWEKQETEVCSGNKGAMLDYILYIFRSYIAQLYIVDWSFVRLSNSYCKNILCNCILYKMYENIAKGTMDSMVECFFLNQKLQHTIRPGNDQTCVG